MKVICSWCRGEGRSGFLGEKAPLDDMRETHSICFEHETAVRALLDLNSLDGLHSLEVLAERLRAGFVRGSFRSLKETSSNSQRARFDLSLSVTANTP